MPNAGDELHHFGWNACSSCLCPNAPHPHVERRYLVVPGLRSSRIHILDTKPDPEAPEDRQGDRARGDRREGRLHPAAHRPLRAGRHLRGGARQRRGQGPGRRVPDGPRELRRARPLGDRPRAAASRLRRLVAPRPRHHGDQRMGHARHVRERPRAGDPARRQVRPAPAFLGPAQAQAPADHRFRRRAPARLRAAARRTTRPRPTASSIA